MLKIEMDEEEISAIYRHIDANGDGNVSYQEFVEKFAKVNIAQLLKNINKIVKSSGNDAESLFNMHCSDKRTQNMSKTDFKKMARAILNKMADFEMEMLFRHFDTDHKGTISK